MPVRSLLPLLVAAMTPVTASATPAAEPLTIGETLMMPALGEMRQINVALPKDYGTGDKRYPLIVLLDGGLDQDFYLHVGLERWNQLWQRSQPAIIVGIETRDRQRELLPPTSDPAERKRYPNAGESAAFRQWLIETVLPELRRKYRTDGRAFLIGESAAGHFVVETWTTRLQAFDGYAAISPSLQWGKEALLRQFAAKHEVTSAPLFLSLANEGGATQDGVERVVAARGSSICFADRRTEVVHANALHRLLPEALQFLLPTKADWLEESGLGLRCAKTAARP